MILQVGTGDGWSDVAREFRNEDGSLNPVAAVFFAAYVFVVGLGGWRTGVVGCWLGNEKHKASGADCDQIDGLARFACENALLTFSALLWQCCST